MKIVFKGIAVAAAFSATLGTGIFIGTAQADQPAMWSALHSLQDARTQLQNASDDKGGHRVRAINLIGQAIYEVRQGIEYGRDRGWHDHHDWH